MRIAILSDIHGNMPALQAVLDDMVQCCIDQTFCLGDSINYGGDSNEVVKTLIGRNIPSVLGNHEAALFKPEMWRYYNDHARESIQLTQKLVSQQTIDFINELPTSISFGDMRMVHGVPPDNYNDYLDLIAHSELRRILEALSERIVFTGHSHDLQRYSLKGSRLHSQALLRGQIRLSPERKHIINAGSVGQPRDGDPAAKYVIYDSQTYTLDVRFVSYDIERAMQSILQKGYPEFNALRLQ